MAQKVLVTVSCDLPHDQDTNADRTIRFSIDGAHYELDACTPHAEDWEADMGGYTAAARKTAARTTTARPAGGLRAPQPPRNAESRQQRARIRAWAARRYDETGDTKYQCSERGRLPQPVIALYAEETGDQGS